MTPMRSASAAASRKSWVTISVGSARLRRARPAARRARRARVWASSAESGSSSSRTPGSRASARASATRWRSPPDSAPGRSSARWRDAHALEQLADAAPRRPAEGDVGAHGHVREERVLLEDEARPSARSGGRSTFARRVEPRALAERDPPAVGPAQARRSRAGRSSCPRPRARRARRSRRRCSGGRRARTSEGRRRSRARASPRGEDLVREQHPAAEYDEQHADGQRDVEVRLELLVDGQGQRLRLRRARCRRR